MPLDFMRLLALGQNIWRWGVSLPMSPTVFYGRADSLEGDLPQWMHGNNLLSYGAWFLGTVLGTILGGLLPNPESFGLDFALVAMFIGIFSSQFLIMLRRIDMRLPVILNIPLLSLKPLKVHC